MASNDDPIDAMATFIVNTILEQLRDDHEEEVVHEDHQEKWEALVEQGIRDMVKAHQRSDEAERNALAPSTLDSLDISDLMTALEKLLFGIHSQAPHEWLITEATKAQRLFWALKIQMADK